MDIFQELETPTEVKSQGDTEKTFSLSENDFQDKLNEPIKEPVKKLPASVSAEIYLDSFEGLVLNFGGSMLYRRRLTKRYFGTPERRDEAEFLQSKPEKDIKEDEKILIEKYNKYNLHYEKIAKLLPLDSEEKAKTLKPLTKIIEMSGGDLPPGIALLLAALGIIVARMDLV